jgi:hypothetical protein
MEMNEMKALIEEADKYHKISFDESKNEEETDAAYAEYWSRLEKIADLLFSITGGKIDHKTGLKMAAHKADKILDLLKRAA